MISWLDLPSDTVSTGRIPVLLPSPHGFSLNCSCPPSLPQVVWYYFHWLSHHLSEVTADCQEKLEKHLHMAGIESTLVILCLNKWDMNILKERLVLIHILQWLISIPTIPFFYAYSTEFISHSFSLMELKFLYQHVLPDLTGKVVVDVGSRLGAVLFGVKPYLGICF